MSETEKHIVWTWCHPKHGVLQTIIEPTRVSEARKHAKDTEFVVNAVGAIQSKHAAAVAVAAKRVLQNANHATLDRAHYAVSIKGESGVHACLISGMDEPMQALQAAVLKAREVAEGGRLAWRSLGGRLAFVFAAVTLLVVAFLIHGWRQSNGLQVAGQSVSALVTERSGANGFDKDKFIVVRYELPANVSANASPQPLTVKIDKYLSDENWRAATPGATITLLAHGTLGVYVAADIERFQRQKKYFILLPLLFGGLAIGALFVLPKYRIGSRSDGDEYIVDGDQVIGDDKDMPISRTAINMGRFLWHSSR
jgi:hypothetical protein